MLQYQFAGFFSMCTDIIPLAIPVFQDQLWVSSTLLSCSSNYDTNPTVKCVSAFLGTPTTAPSLAYLLYCGVVNVPEY